MSKAYILHEDHHNRPILETYDDMEKAVSKIADCEGASEEEIMNELEDSDEYSGCDTWTVVDEYYAIGMVAYWQSVRDAIREDKEAPL